MKKFTDELIEEIKLNNDVLDVVSEYVKLIRKGKDYFGLCPFHSEKTPSFSVVPNKDIYYCFGCHSGGSVIQFIMNIENLKYYEAIEFLAKKANITIPEDIDPRYTVSNRKKEVIRGINKKSAQFYFENLKKHKNAREYLLKREIGQESIVKFGIGYADDKWDSLFEYLIKEGYTEEDIREAGLISKNKVGGYYDKFRDRIIFPIFDVYDNVIAFGGRVINEGNPKYLNSPETLVYKKGKHLYGLNFSKKTQSDLLIVVEGYMDVVTLYQQGLDFFVASLGTALTIDQARLINRYDKKIILAYDSDSAGENASLRALDVFLKLGVEPSVIVMKDAKDPDEFVKKFGIKKFEEVLRSALTPIEYKVLLLKKKYSTDNTQERVELFRSLISILSEIDDMTLIDMYASKYSIELNISKDAIINDVNRKKRTIKNDLTDNMNKIISTQNFDKLNQYEMLLLLFYFNHKMGKEKIEEYFNNTEMSDDVINKIFVLLFRKKSDTTLADILECTDKEYITTVIKLNEMVENVDKKEKALEDFFKKIQYYQLENTRTDLNSIGKKGILDIHKLREYSEKMKRFKEDKEDK